jgi:putative DNA primase/helicase
MTTHDHTEVIAMANNAKRYVVPGNGHDPDEHRDAPSDPPSELFRVVDMAAELQHAKDHPQGWVWDGYIPQGFVTILGAHGGAGKSFLALMIAACVAMGLPVLGRATSRTRVLFVNAEDPASLVLTRLDRICTRLGLDFDEVMRWVQVIDLSDLDPALYTEQRLQGGVRHGRPTPAYEAITEYVRAGEFGFVIVDNASDVFDGDEINRAMVRGFLRSLAAWARPAGAVLLLAHVDKATSRAGPAAGKTGNTEAYSGSTAWNNSARSRLFLKETGEGEFELQHHKCNLARKQPPLGLEWPQDDVMQVRAAGGMVAVIERKGDTRALLGLIAEFYSRQEWVASAAQSTNNAARMLAQEKGYPKHLKAGEVLALLRDAQRDHLIEVEGYRDEDQRKPKKRWRLTAAGYELAALAAPSAPSS